MNESGVLSLKDVQEVCDRQRHQVDAVINWHGKTLNIRRYLPLEEEHRIIKEVVEWCESVPHEECLYYYDFFLKINIICAYANIELSDDINEQHFLIYMTDIYNVLYREIRTEQVESIKETVLALLT